MRSRQAIAIAWPSLRAYSVGGNGELGDPDGAWHEAYGVEAVFTSRFEKLFGGV